MRKVLTMRAALAALPLFASLAAVAPAQAVPITVQATRQFLQTTGSNPYGLWVGTGVYVGAVATPHASGGTMVTATQGGYAMQLGAVPYSPSFPNEYSAVLLGTPPALTGAWRLDFRNGADTATAMTPALEGATPVALASNMRLSREGESLRFAWDLPAESDIDQVQVRLLTRRAAGAPVEIRYLSELGGPMSSFDLPRAWTFEGVERRLVTDGLYTLALYLYDMRETGPHAGTAQARSITYFGFRAPAAEAAVPVGGTIGLVGAGGLAWLARRRRGGRPAG